MSNYLRSRKRREEADVEPTARVNSGSRGYGVQVPASEESAGGTAQAPGCYRHMPAPNPDGPQGNDSGQ